MRRLDAKVAAANLKGAEPPPPKEAGPAALRRRRQVRRAATRSAVAFWKKTVHAAAWKTLVEGGKQDGLPLRQLPRHRLRRGRRHQPRATPRSCATYSARSATARDSTHVAEEGLEDPLAVRKETPASTCTTCHNEQHSDTFQYEAYLRDILGSGHGAKRPREAGRRPDRARAAHGGAGASQGRRQGAKIKKSGGAR